ncbi:MAG: DUF1963 domain-containing protein [Nitrospinales bacterium]
MFEKIFNLFKRKEETPQFGWEEIKDVLEPYKKTAWFPVIKEKDADTHSSKFSGLPVLLHNENWPCCKHCENPMQLFLQLNSKHLPNESEYPFGNGVLQVFYCTNEEEQCEIECEAFFPFAKSTLVRVLNPDIEKSKAIDDSPVKAPFPAKEIIGWEKKDDYPNWVELEELGVKITDQQSDVLADLDFPASKDKLLGWPCWIQGVEYPACPDCGKKMRYIFQIDSEDNLPHMFGDSGCSYITQCEEHRNRMTIAWACM